MSDAEETAVAVLGWLAGQPELMSRFLALSGLSADGLAAGGDASPASSAACSPFS